MKTVIVVIALLVAIAKVRAVSPEPDMVARIYFAGESGIALGRNAAAFTNQFSSIEALALRKQTADKLSIWLAGWLAEKAGSNVADGATRLRPMLDDLQKYPWLMESRLTGDGRPRVAMVIKLDASRAQVWQVTIKAFFPAATFVYQDGWLTFIQDATAAEFGGKLAGKLIQPEFINWMSLDVNWPLFSRWHPQLKSLRLPETQLAISGSETGMLVNGKFLFSDNLQIKLEPWKIPTNTIRQPFNSITAVRGFGPWLESQTWMQSYRITPMANQYFVWALPQVPYQTFAAAPCEAPADALSQAYSRIQAILSAPGIQSLFLTPIQAVQTNNEVSLHGVPFVGPYLRSLKEPSGEFLLAGAFPNTARPSPMPAELFQRLEDKSLVYYHWEMTSDRFPNLLNLCQLSLALTSHRQLGGDSVSMKWIQKIAQQSENNLTIITQTGPAEMTFTRKANGLFTAMELFVLGAWLESPGFPSLDLKLPPRPNRLNRPQAFPLTIPAPGKN